MPPTHAELLHTFLALSLVAVLSLSGILTFVLGSRLQSSLPFLVAAAAAGLSWAFLSRTSSPKPFRKREPD